MNIADVKRESKELISRAIARGEIALAPVIPPNTSGVRRGRRWTLEQRLVQGQKLRGRKISEATKAAMSIAAQNRTESK